MAIAFDAAANGEGTTTSLSYAHTCSGSNRILWVSVVANVAPNDHTDYITGITYNSVAMTRAAFRAGTSANNDPIWLYFLVNPSTGSHNVVVSSSGSKPLYSVSSSYTGAAQTLQPDNATTNDADTVSTITTSILTNVANSWIISACGDGQNGSPTAGTGLNATRSAENFESVTADTNGGVSATVNSVTWNLASNSQPTVVVASFYPASGGNTYRMMMGVGE